MRVYICLAYTHACTHTHTRTHTHSVMDLYKIAAGFIEGIHNNCELPVGIYNICVCLVWIKHWFRPGAVLISVIDMFMFL